MTTIAPLFDEAEVLRRVTDVARRINEDFAGKTVDVVVAINGGATFAADLARRLTVDARVHPLGFTSYPTPNASGEVRITLDVAEPLFGRDVLLVEGIVVSGRTPRYVLETLRLRQPASLAVCALGVKRRALAVELPIAYAAFELGDEVVVGYGIGSGPEKALPYLGAR